jgi:hypothetical protein
VHVDAAARECATLLGLVDSPVRQSAYLQEMARHLTVPAPTLERLLRRQARPRRADGDGQAESTSQVAVAAPKPLSLLERSEIELLACVLARPAVLVDLDLDDAPLEREGVAQLFAMATDGVAMGRATKDELLKYLFARAAEQAELRTLLGIAADRAARLAEPEAMLAGLLEGRRRLGGEPRRRSLRQQLQQALAAGDRPAADELQRQLLAHSRRDLPRATSHDANDLPTPPATPPTTPPETGEPTDASSETSVPPF